MITKLDAIQSLRPFAEYTLRGEELEWLDNNYTEPTDSEIQSEIARLEAEHAATQYQRDRKAEYPSIEECVHAILDGELDALQAVRAEIKARYPKP
jgi:hypothetical protein